MSERTPAEHWEQAAITAAQKRWQAERETEGWRSRAERAEAVLRLFKEALSFYADEDKYDDIGNEQPSVMWDGGQIARDALARQEARWEEHGYCDCGKCIGLPPPPHREARDE